MADLMKGKKILVVDDDPDVLMAIKMALADEGAVVLEAADGVVAVDVNDKEQPEFVILDMMLPKRGGFLVLERIRKGKARGAKPYVIMITGNLGSRHKTYAESLGVADYINKPFRMERLLNAIKKLLAPPEEAPV